MIMVTSLVRTGPQQAGPPAVAYTMHCNMITYPVLPFLGLSENAKENLKNTKEFLTSRTLKTPEKLTENPTPKDQGSHKEGKTPRTQKHQGKEGHGT